MRDNEPDEADNKDQFDSEVEAMEDSLELRVGVPLRAELHADVGQRVAPGPGTNEGVDVEAELVHLRNTGGESDKGADDGKHASDQHSDGAEAGEEVIDKVEIAPTEEHPAAVALNHGASTTSTDPVGRDGTEVRGQRSNGRKDDELQLRRGKGVACEGHDDFRGDGNAGGLDCHEQDDT